jgi:hypothetical protein
MIDIVVFISVNLPDLCMRLPFHTSSLSATLLINECQAAYGNLDVKSGMPK